MGFWEDSPRSACLSQGAQGPFPKLFVTDLGIDDLGKSQMEVLEGRSELRYLIQSFYPRPEIGFLQLLDRKLVVLRIEYGR
jgi:hypothetical protein